MKILQVIHDFLPRHRAGAEIYTFNLCACLAKKHDVHLLFTEHEPAKAEYSLERGQYKDIPFTRVINNHCRRAFEETYNDSAMDAVFRTVLDETRPDIIHFQHLLYHSVNYVGIARERGIPTVATLHDFWPLCEQEGKRIRPSFENEKEPGGDSLKLCEEINPSLCARCVSCWPTIAPRSKRAVYDVLQKIRSLTGWDPTNIAKRLSEHLPEASGPPKPILNVKADQIAARNEYIRRAYAQIDRIISPSPFLKSEFERHGYPAEKIILSDYGFDTSPFERFDREPTEGVRFGFVGTVSEMKGVHVLAEAFNRLEDRKATLHVFGSMETFPRYANRVRSLIGRDGAYFHGAFEPADVARTFEQFDVLVTPSIWYENSPLVIHEAFMSGTPVIATNLGGMADLVRDGEWGLLFERGDNEDLADKMARLSQEPGLIAKLSSNIPPVKTIQDDADKLTALYGRFISR
ncbi:MAG: glycosyltransferase family 4 protein [Planctomycetota bacterium]